MSDHIDWRLLGVFRHLAPVHPMYAMARDAAGLRWIDPFRLKKQCDGRLP